MDLIWLNHNRAVDAPPSLLPYKEVEFRALSCLEIFLHWVASRSILMWLYGHHFMSGFIRVGAHLMWCLKPCTSCLPNMGQVYAMLLISPLNQHLSPSWKIFVLRATRLPCSHFTYISAFSMDSLQHLAAIAKWLADKYPQKHFLILN